MSQAEIDEFLAELEIVVESYKKDSSYFSIISDASHKSFADLSAVRSLSLGMKEILDTNFLQKFAIFRPQNDHLDESDHLKSFDDLREAKDWIES